MVSSSQIYQRTKFGWGQAPTRAGQQPLWRLPVGVGPEGQPTGYYWAHSPVSTSDLLKWRNSERTRVYPFRMDGVHPGFWVPEGTPGFCTSLLESCGSHLWPLTGSWRVFLGTAYYHLCTLPSVDSAGTKEKFVAHCWKNRQVSSNSSRQSQYLPQNSKEVISCLSSPWAWLSCTNTWLGWENWWSLF